MATINGIYIFVESEERTYGVEATSHPVETGVPVTDHVQRKARTISISGEIVGSDAVERRKRIATLHANGILCAYAGRSRLSNCIISDLSYSYPYDVWGGCKFSATLTEIRVAKSAYTKKKTTNTTSKTATKTASKSKSGTQQTTSKSTSKNVYHTTKKGDTVWGLVEASNAPYKKYGATCKQVMNWNPKAFSKSGDYSSLKIGYKLKVGERK